MDSGRCHEIQGKRDVEREKAMGDEDDPGPKSRPLGFLFFVPVERALYVIVRMYEGSSPSHS